MFAGFEDSTLRWAGRRSTAAVVGVWSFLAAPYPVTETLIARSPATLVDHMLDTWASVPDAFPPEIRQEHLDKFSRPATIHAICEEYGAAATLDAGHFLPEEAPDEVVREFVAFFGECT